MYLGIDTSKYTTSVALKEGQLGLRQSDAVFHHTAQLHTLFSMLVSDIDTKEIAAIGASVRPRPIEGSYMPCFTVGENTAKILSSAWKIPLYSFSHQEGHIAAALFSADRTDLFTQTFLAFHVSGGTTEAVIAHGQDSGFAIEMAAKTLDLNAGQAVDRVGLMLGLRFPCGMALEQLAAQNTEPIKARPTMKGCDCCLSGVENRCRKLLADGKSKPYVAAFCLESIRVTLAAMTDAIFASYGKIPAVYAGGVMSNQMIKNSFEEKYNAVFAEPVYSSDNAAGIAYLCYRKHHHVHT